MIEGFIATLSILLSIMSFTLGFVIKLSSKLAKVEKWLNHEHERIEKIEKMLETLLSSGKRA